MRSFFNHLKKSWELLVGKAVEFTLTVRLFHAISLGIVALAVIYIPYNIIAGLYVAAASAVVVAALFYYEYYRSRFKGRKHRSAIIGITGLLLFSVNYFTNAGIAGSTDLIWPVYLMLLLTICPRSQHFWWVAIYLLNFVVIHIMEYLHPDWVQYPFSPGNGQVVDRITAFPIPVIVISIVVGLFRRSYETERARVEQRDAEKTRLLSVLSHDLRSPFIQIRNYLELLEDDDLPPAERQQMRQIIKQTNHATLELLTNLLYWSRSQLDGARVQLQSFILINYLSDATGVATMLATQKNIALHIDVAAGTKITGDADMLQLVIRNLLLNAIKFIPAGGAVTLSAQTIGDVCTIKVADNGPGLTAGQQADIFLGTATPGQGTANEKGVGLGLLVCREFIEMQGGTITAGSNQGGGALFTVQLPRG